MKRPFLFEPRKGRTFIHVFENGVKRIFEKLKGQRYQVLVKTEDCDLFKNSEKKKEVLEKPEEKPKDKKRSIKKKFTSNNKFALLSFSESDSE